MSSEHPKSKSLLASLGYCVALLVSVMIAISCGSKAFPGVAGDLRLVVRAVEWNSKEPVPSLPMEVLVGPSDSPERALVRGTTNRKGEVEFHLAPGTYTVRVSGGKAKGFVGGAQVELFEDAEIEIKLLRAMS